MCGDRRPGLVTLAILQLRVLLAAGGRVCSVLVGVDEPLYNHYHHNMTELTRLVENHFDGVNEIFRDNETGPFTGDLADLRFKVSRVQVVFGACDQFQYENCTEDRSKYLEIFDQYDFREFCLAYMFTYLDFHNGTAGLATVGALCRPRQNSGFITLLNHGQQRETAESVLTLAHELGHSLGADHDQEVEGEECGSSYIMTASTNSSVPLEAVFSSCSVAAMRPVLAAASCLREDDLEPLEVAVCGNSVLEPGEQCDCGPGELDCSDPCCYPAHISEAERAANSSAQPCSRAARSRCVTPPELFYGIYLPLVFILVATILVAVFLRHDWTRDKSLFRHITEGNIRIVSKAAVTRAAQRTAEPATSGEQAAFK